MRSWQDHAEDVLQALDETLPDQMTKLDRIKAVQAAYPFGARSGWPYKAWLKARRRYLGMFNEDGLRCWPKRPSGLEHLPRDPATGRPVIQ